jgi:CheY-like chemotaxis protein
MARVLLVEDDSSIRCMVTTILSRFGHEVVEAENGFVALTILMDDTVFDVVVTDIRMPVVDGIKLTQTIKQEFPSIPVIATSILAESECQAIAKGVDHYIQKPFTYQQLLSCLPTGVQYASA